MLPCDRLTEIMRDLFGCPSFREGTLANFGADCSRRLEPVDTFIRDLAAKAEVAGFDETGVHATGSLHWLLTVSTRQLRHPNPEEAGLRARSHSLPLSPLIPLIPPFKGNDYTDK